MFEKKLLPNPSTGGRCKYNKFFYILLILYIVKQPKTPANQDNNSSQDSSGVNYYKTICIIAE